METPKLFEALAAAQADVEGQKKDTKNEYHGYRYTSMEDLLIEGRRVLSKYGLAASIDAVRIDAGRDCDIATFTCTLRHKSGESLSFERQEYILPDKGRPPDKALATANTFAIGYWLRDLLLIPRLVDDEPDKRDDSKYEPPRRYRKDDPRTAAVPPRREDVMPVPPPPSKDSGASPAMLAPVIDDKAKVEAACKALMEAPSVEKLLQIGAVVRTREKDGVFSKEKADDILHGTLGIKMHDLIKFGLDAAADQDDVQKAATAIAKAFKAKLIDNGMWAELTKLCTNATDRLAKSPMASAGEFFGGEEIV